MHLHNVHLRDSPIVLLKEALKSLYRKDKKEAVKSETPDLLPKFFSGLRVWKHKAKKGECYILSTKTLNLAKTFKIISQGELQPSSPLKVKFFQKKLHWYSSNPVFFLSDTRYEYFDKDMMHYSFDSLRKDESEELLGDQYELTSQKYISLRGMLTFAASESDEKLCEKVRYAIKKTLFDKACSKTTDSYNFCLMKVPCSCKLSSYRSYWPQKCDTNHVVGFIYSSGEGEKIFHKCISDRIENYGDTFRCFKTKFKVFNEGPFGCSDEYPAYCQTREEAKACK